MIARTAYTQRHAFPKWNIHPTVLQEPRLMRRVYPFAAWSKVSHGREAETATRTACRLNRAYIRLVRASLATYGGQGPLIAGIARAHFPDTIKDRLRSLARRATFHQDRALAHWQASGRRVSTFRTSLYAARQGRTMI